MRKAIFGTALALGLAVTTMTPASAAKPSAPEPTDTGEVTISGTVGTRVSDEGTIRRLRYVGNPAPEGYTGNYQVGPSISVASPEDGPVTMTGTLDLSDLVKGPVAGIGLYDTDALAAGGTSHEEGAEIYITNRGDAYDIGVSDGKANGDTVQSFARIPASELDVDNVEVKFVVDGTAAPASCVNATPEIEQADLLTADGCMTLTINGITVTDSYGSISPDGGAGTEFANGATPGWYAFLPGGTVSPAVGYDLTISPASLALATKDQCKDGGFAGFDFKNQGQCIASLKANGNANK